MLGAGGIKRKLTSGGKAAFFMHEKGGGKRCNIYPYTR
ncbi:hypothetical protein AB434_3410 [Heyndrickxia coagulans]|uniref:Uncharacterized protein n=1 Tax=Heyndrickxia coagulans TaxID=1398 RepID=A0AAN0WC73_HEYCO|nr:hypothetical protein SB48_HM08orf02946 [Heyndrickxia coagulans]AKN55815.1 hypothetical protein AB434_3410 [Heyndrickxia coagulans]KYC64082.1 hypothetical protein B4100_3216 [Heyndrickxia coagulans]KYC91647.1 hypothetical protein B4096_2602 [Heyndrickxia coagulans]